MGEEGTRRGETENGRDKVSIPLKAEEKVREEDGRKTGEKGTDSRIILSAPKFLSRKRTFGTRLVSAAKEKMYVKREKIMAAKRQEEYSTKRKIFSVKRSLY